MFCDEVLHRLSRRDDTEVTAYAVSWRGRRELAALLPRNVRCGRGPMMARVLHECWQRFDHPPIEWSTGPVDVVHGTNYVVPPSRRAAEVVTIHDFSPVRFPELASPANRSWPALMQRAIERGAWVHAVSHFVAAEVVEHYRIDPARVAAIPNGAVEFGPDHPGADAATGIRLAGCDNYVLALGTVEPRKNLPALIGAFDRVAGRHNDLRLVLAGPDGHGSKALDDSMRAARHRDRIIRLGWVNKDQRAALLRAAAVLAYPSRYEGFGLPALEAQSVGTPVITTDAGALPEVVADSALVVPAASLDADPLPLAEALDAVLDDNALRARLVESGRTNVERFSWDACVDGLVDLYRRAFRSR